MSEPLPLGTPVPNWAGATPAQATPMQGRTCRLVPLEAAHAEDLFAAFALDTDGHNWTYLPYGPFDDLSAFTNWLAGLTGSPDPLFFAILDPGGRAIGMASYLRIAPEPGTIEIGHIHLSPALQRHTAATEALALMMMRAMDDWGYRRLEWKCNALNKPSCNAAERLGFTYEGTFRNAGVVKGRNRDTAWYSITDAEWPAISRALKTWLSPENFDAEGRQKTRLNDAMQG